MAIGLWGIVQSGVKTAFSLQNGVVWEVQRYLEPESWSSKVAVGCPGSALCIVFLCLSQPVPWLWASSAWAGPSSTEYEEVILHVLVMPWTWWFCFLYVLLSCSSFRSFRSNRFAEMCSTINFSFLWFILNFIWKIFMTISRNDFLKITCLVNFASERQSLWQYWLSSRSLGLFVLGVQKVYQDKCLSIRCAHSV